MSSEFIARFEQTFGEYFPTLLRRLRADGAGELVDTYQAIDGALRALEDGSLSWARLNQTIHRCSEAGLSEGFFRYYFLEAPQGHPYPVDRVLADGPFTAAEGSKEILSLRQLQWGLRRFIYDSMLYWGNFRQAYRDLRQLAVEEIRQLFSLKQVNEKQMKTRGRVQEPTTIARDHRYLISEVACKTYEAAPSIEETQHVKLALAAFRALRSEGREVTPVILKQKTRELAEGAGQGDLFELMYEEAVTPIRTVAEVVALYSGQRESFLKAREDALHNTRIYLSSCNDLDVYVATSMRVRQDFREMTTICDSIFNSDVLKDYNLRYFDPTLSAAQYHEDKGIVECLMVRTAKVLLYFSQHKESLGKVSEYAMALSLGKPVIVLCPDDSKGKELYHFYREAHPLMRLVEFETGTVNGAMITNKVDDVIELLRRIFSNGMEYDLARKNGTEAYYLLKERLTGTTVRVITQDPLLTATFWNNWHGIS